MPFTFRGYTAEELPDCAKAFCEDFRDPEISDWTRAVMQWFSEAKAPGVRALWRCRDESKNKERIFDQCHVRFQNPSSFDLDLWMTALEGDCRILLALECEWGKRGSAKANLCMILDDAYKLAVVRAGVKIMLFSSQGHGEDREDIVGCLKKLRKATRDLAPWLWLDLPWEESPPRRIGWDIFEGQAGV